MKINEEKIRAAMDFNRPFVVVTNEGNRILVWSRDHLSLPPLEDENGVPLADETRADLFWVWSDGKRCRGTPFAWIAAIETTL